MRDIIDRLSTVAVLFAAVFACVVLFKRETSPSLMTFQDSPAIFEGDWPSYEQSGTRIGSRSARVTIVEFADLECPFCARLHSAIDSLRDRYGEDNIALIFIHFPLSSHKFAKPAALAAECAKSHGRFQAFISRVYQNQDSLGLKGWSEYAYESGVADTAAFSACVKSTRTSTVVQAGIALGRSLNVRGTPTVLINGWRYHRVPFDSLSDIVGRLASGV